MMASALYYPHTQLAPTAAGERLLKRALLLWDRLEFIVPYKGYAASYSGAFKDAIDVIGDDHVPTDEEKNRAHDRIQDLIFRPAFPSTFFQYSSKDIYEIYPQKFLENTWELLQRSGITSDLKPDGDFQVTQKFGLAMMSILADECAGATRTRVTDYGAAYAGLTGLLAEQNQSEKSTLRDRLQEATLVLRDRKEALISLNLPLLEVDCLQLDQLVQFRKREAKESGHTLRDLRHRYLENIENQIKKLTTERVTRETMTQTDVDEVLRSFQQESEDDLSALKEELHWARNETVFSKEVLVTVLAVAGTLAMAFLPGSPLLHEVVRDGGSPVALGGLIGARSKFQKARLEILRKHPMAFVYQLNS